MGGVFTVKIQRWSFALQFCTENPPEPCSQAQSAKWKGQDREQGSKVKMSLGGNPDGDGMEWTAGERGWMLLDGETEAGSQRYEKRERERARSGLGQTEVVTSARMWVKAHNGVSSVW